MINITQQIEYATQVKSILAKSTIEDTSGMDAIIESLKSFKSSCGSGRGDSYIVEMSHQDYLQFQKYKMLKEFEKSGAMATEPNNKQQLHRQPVKKTAINQKNR